MSDNIEFDVNYIREILDIDDENGFSSVTEALEFWYNL